MAQRPPIKILITGFGPFPGVRSNPSGEFMHAFQDQCSPGTPDVVLHTEVIPTSWAAAERFVSGTLAEFDPDISLHFGIHRRAGGFRIETLARNCACAQADADGKLFGKVQLVPDAPASLRASLAAEKLVHALQARGLPAHTSLDAGRYLCNMLLYLSLNQAKSGKRRRQTGFIHIPPLDPTVRGAARGKQRTFVITTLLDGAQIIMDQCITAHRRTERQRPRSDQG